MAYTSDIVISVLSIILFISLALLVPTEREEHKCLTAISQFIQCSKQNCSTKLERPITLNKTTICCGKMCFYYSTNTTGNYNYITCSGGLCKGI